MYLDDCLKLNILTCHSTWVPSIASFLFVQIVLFNSKVDLIFSYAFSLKGRKLPLTAVWAFLLQ